MLDVDGTGMGDRAVRLNEKNPPLKSEFFSTEVVLDMGDGPVSQVLIRIAVKFLEVTDLAMGQFNPVTIIGRMGRIHSCGRAGIITQKSAHTVKEK